MGEGEGGGAPGLVQPFADVEVLRSIIDNIPAMVFVKEAERLTFALFNRTGEELLGVSRCDLLGRSDFDLFPREQAQRFTEADRAVLAGRRVLDVPEEPIDTSRGRRWLHTRKIGLYAGDGTPRYLVGISEDITERREALGQLEALRGLLERSARLSALGELAGSVAHELNTPLTAIALRAEALRELAASGAVDPQRMAKEAGTIVATVERAARIIRGLRRFGRSAEAEPLQRVHLAALVGDVLEFSRARTHALGIRVDVRIPEDLELACRPVQVGQVVVNLLNNACDAVPAGGDGWVEIAGERAGGEVRLTVTDSGPRIPDAVRSRLMEPFFTTKAAGEGTGLGLSISRGIAEAQGGRLEFDAASANTRFVLTLPAEGGAP